ncbi:hypothetical protein Aduo_003076 [Ancylostoma duodenale]
MKRSGDDCDSSIPAKAFKLNRESLESLDKEALLEKLVSLTDQLNEAKERAKRAKRRESLAYLQLIQNEQKLSDLKRERNDAFYGNGNQRDQLLDPFYYEAYISMKEKVASRDKTIAEQEETINTLKCSEDMKLLYKHIKSREDLSKKHQEYEYNIYRKSLLHNNLNLANSALRAVMKEKKGNLQEIAEKDAKISELYKEIYQLRGELSEDVVFDQIDPDEDTKPQIIRTSTGEAEKRPTVHMMESEDDDDVAILEDNGGIDVDTSILHKTDGSDNAELDRPSGDERSVSVDESGTLKITV